MTTPTISYLATEKDWATAIEANTLPELREAIEPWRSYVPDAAAIVDAMDEATFAEWRAGLAKERQREWAGQEHSEKYGALMIPAKMMEAHLLAKRLHVPFGLALIRIAEQSR